jgi:hypothetical protein
MKGGVRGDFRRSPTRRRENGPFPGSQHTDIKHDPGKPAPSEVVNSTCDNVCNAELSSGLKQAHPATTSTSPNIRVVPGRMSCSTVTRSHKVSIATTLCGPVTAASVVDHFGR